MSQQPWHRHICVWSWRKRAARPPVGLGKLSTKMALTSSTPSYARPQHYPELAKSLGFRYVWMETSRNWRGDYNSPRTSPTKPGVCTHSPGLHPSACPTAQTQ